MNKMRAIILAAGESKRLGEITKNTPKCLLDVNGETILGRQLHWLKECRILDVTIVTGYLGQQIVQYCSKVQNMRIKFVVNNHYQTTNNADSLKLALDQDSSPFILLNGDVVFHPYILKKIYASLKGNCFAVEQKRRSIPEDMKVEILSWNEEGTDDQVARVSKALLTPNEFVGIAKFEDRIDLLRRMLPQHTNRWFEGAVDELITTKQFTVYVEDVEHFPYIEIDFPEDLADAREVFPWGQPDWEQGIRHGTEVNQDKAFELLVDTVEALKQYKIKYWLNWGTLLGLYRDKQFIPWDTDIDVTVHAENREHVWDKIAKEMKRKFCFVPQRELCYPGDCWFIRDKEKIELNFVERVNNTYSYEPDRCDLACPVEYIENLTTLRIRDYEFAIPSNPEEYLRRSYGDNWKTPIKNKKPVSVATGRRK